MAEERRRLNDLHEPSAKIMNLRNQFVSEYQAHTLQYHNKPEEDIFPRAYHTLVHCPVSSIFDTLLELEQGYATSIQELYAAGEHEREEIQTRHAREIESSPQTQTNMTSLFTRHVEEIELFRATWDSDILQTQQTQRREYREFVIELYREYQLRLAALSNEKHLLPEDALAVAGKQLDGKEIIAAAAGRVRQWTSGSHKDGSTSTNSDNQPTEVTSPLTRRRQSSSASYSSQHSHQSASPNEQAALTRASTEGKEKSLAFQKNVKSIQEMGFSKEMAETALVLTNQDLEQSVQLLIENPQKVTNAQKTTSTPFRRSSSVGHVQRPTYSNPSSPAHSRNSSYNEPNTNNRRHSLQKLATTPAFLNLMGSNALNGRGKGWSPISFLQQQKQAMENTNLSSVRKFGSWLGKAMENLGIENDESDPRFASSGGASNSQQLVEAFSISLGTAHIKSAHNFRLLAADASSDIFNPLPYEASREMGYKAQTATKLYSSHLSAMIVLVELNELKNHQQPGKLDWRQYKSGKGSNKALFERCQHSTEFHFPDIESQLSVIENDLESCQQDLQEGSFFITRHSNLPLNQVIFHLVIDSDGNFV
ncbi:hypothetical protein DFQ28_007213 [Apophysomyces sp. BC1034]|nr:hypothetical protein DFQ28_007213 [Apophysomyces sp. BC1034]